MALHNRLNITSAVLIVSQGDEGKSSCATTCIGKRHFMIYMCEHTIVRKTPADSCVED